MKKLTALCLGVVLLAPMVGMAQSWQENDPSYVPVDECTNTKGFPAVNYVLCQQLMRQILQLQVQILTLQLQILLKGQSAGLRDVPAGGRLEDQASNGASGGVPTDTTSFEATQRATVNIDEPVCKNGNVELPIVGGGDWQQVMVKVWNENPRGLEWNTRIENKMDAKQVRKEIFELHYDLGRSEDVQYGLKLTYKVDVYASAPSRARDKYIVATENGEFVWPNCSE